MKPARIIILAVAILAAGIAGLLAMRLSAPREDTADNAPVTIQKAPSKPVLVASGSLPVGSHLTDQTMKWVDWPEETIVKGMITQTEHANALTDMAGAIVRMPIFEGEPIRQEKIADSSSQVLASLLPAGKRAIATDITVSTGAGGFILPNDRVDVIMVKKDANGTEYRSETVLSNIRVLAIDQVIEQKGDEKSVVGTTATLELNADQARAMAVAQQMADKLTLVLRSIADAQEPDNGVPDHMLTGSTAQQGIIVIKSGEIVNSQQSQ